MTAFNLFMNGVFHTEVMWADALVPNDVRASYRTSLLPFGVFRIEEKKKSPFWQLLKNSWDNQHVEKPKLEPLVFSEVQFINGSQPTIF